MNIEQCFESDGRVVKKLNVEGFTIEQATRLLVEFEAKWDDHEAQKEALQQRVDTRWKRDFLDADNHGHPEDSELMQDWRLAGVLNTNGVYMPPHIGALKKHILKLCREQYGGLQS